MREGAFPQSVPFTTETEIDAALPRVLEQLRRGLLIAYPTETAYGLGSSLTTAAIDRLAAFKGRDATKPFLMLIDGTDMLNGMRLSLRGPAAELAARFWPGPLTLVLGGVDASGHRLLRGDGGGVAVRCTAHHASRRIVRALGSPITSTSANVSGLPPAIAPAKIIEQWEQAVTAGDLLVLDGGELHPGPPSTVVDCSEAPPRVLRRGAVDVDALRAVVPGLVGEG